MAVQQETHMENKFSYTLVGTFVIGFLLFFIGLTIWLTSGMEKTKTQEYQVITSESVLGLSVNSQIDYRGVNIGKVADISLNKNDPRFVTITLNINEGTPIKSDTRAVLMSKGITGLVGVSLTGGTPEADFLVPTEENPIPVIMNGPSLSKRLDEAIDNITDALDDLSDKLEDIFTPNNIENFSKIMANVESFTEDLSNAGPRIQKLTDSASILVESMKPQMKLATESIHKFAQNLDNSSDDFKQFIDSLNSVVKNANGTITSWGSFANQTDRKLQNLYPLLETALYNFSSLMEEFKEQPNSVITGKPKPKRGPGE